jgi:hypothetical protein
MNARSYCNKGVKHLPQRSIILRWKAGAVMIQLLTIVVSVFSLGFMAGYALRAFVSHSRHMHRHFD